MRRKISGNSDAVLSVASDQLFDPALGFNVIHPPLDTSGGTVLDNVFTWRLWVDRLTVGGSDWGTAAADKILLLEGVSLAACEAFNERATGSSAISTYTVGSGIGNGIYSLVRRDGTEFLNTAATEEIATPDVDICVTLSTNSNYHVIVYSLESN